MIFVASPYTCKHELSIHWKIGVMPFCVCLRVQFQCLFVVEACHKHDNQCDRIKTGSVTAHLGVTC